MTAMKDLREIFSSFPFLLWQRNRGRNDRPISPVRDQLIINRSMRVRCYISLMRDLFSPIFLRVVLSS